MVFTATTHLLNGVKSFVTCLITVVVQYATFLAIPLRLLVGQPIKQESFMAGTLVYPRFDHFAAANPGDALLVSPVAKPTQIAIPAERITTRPERAIQLMTTPTS